MCQAAENTDNSIDSDQEEEYEHERFHFFSCQFCAYQSKNLFKLITHEQKCYSTENTKKSEWVCSSVNVKLFCFICKIGFKHLRSWEKHKKMHSHPGSLLCIVCGQRFWSFRDRYHHNQVQHRDRRNRTCENCGQLFKSRNCYQLHMNSKCETIKSYECDKCKICFMSKSILNTHKLIHVKELKYSCKYCEKRFAKKLYLVVHERTHTGEKPYKCNICDLAFTHGSSLSRHKILHTDEKPYRCHLCNKTFAQQSTLVSHAFTHNLDPCSVYNEVLTSRNILHKNYEQTDCNKVLVGSYMADYNQIVQETKFPIDVMIKCDNSEFEEEVTINGCIVKTQKDSSQINYGPIMQEVHYT